MIARNILCGKPYSEFDNEDRLFVAKQFIEDEKDKKYKDGIKEFAWKCKRKIIEPDHYNGEFYGWEFLDMINKTLKEMGCSDE